MSPVDEPVDAPLAHLRVLDLSRLQPGAYCTGMLADLGADVLKIEPPSGDPLRMLPGAPAAYHRGKRAMTLDLKHERAGEILRRLIAATDVVVDSGLPATTAATRASATSRRRPPNRGWCGARSRASAPTPHMPTGSRTTSAFSGTPG